MSIGNKIYAGLRGDRTIWMVLILLSIFSLLAVYSATGLYAYQKYGGNMEAALFKHLVFLSGGLFLTYICYTLHYRQYMRISPILLIICIPLLVYTIGFGVEVNEAKRWVEVPFIGLTFQTSEFAKLVLIIYVARAISAKQEYIKDFQSAFLPIIVPILIICSLIAPSDLSSAMLLFFVTIGMMFLGRVALKYILLLIFLGVVVFAMLIIIGQVYPDLVRSATWITRMQEFMDATSDGSYQIVHSKIAIADGEIFGAGPGNSVMRNYLPAPYSDFVFSIICEEYGLVGAFVTLSLYVLLFFRCVGVVTRAPKAFGAMLVMGLGLLLVGQALANMAVAVDLVPVTGLTLPLLSMGGTSIMFTCIAFGMILSVSRYIEKAT